MIRGAGQPDTAAALLSGTQHARRRSLPAAGVTGQDFRGPIACGCAHEVFEKSCYAGGEFHRAWTSGEDWERVQITADQCPRISAEHLAAERIRLGDALHRQEYFGTFVSAPGSVFDAEVLAQYVLAMMRNRTR